MMAGSLCCVLISQGLMAIVKGFTTKDDRQTTAAQKQRDRVVSTSDSQSGGPGFESRCNHLPDLFSVVPSSNLWPHL